VISTGNVNVFFAFAGVCHYTYAPLAPTAFAATMTSARQNLDELRREIDRIDDAMHDLVMRRADVARAVMEAKGNGPMFRPAREAQLLRRLVKRHKGPLPPVVVARVWREMMAANLRLQTTFSVAVCAGRDAAPGIWDLARDHYGVAGPMLEMASPAQVVRAVADGEALVGVLPTPAEDDKDPWWPALTAAGGDKGQPRIVARLPFVAGGNARGERTEALSIARIEPEATGNDRSLLVIETSLPISRARLADALRQSGLAPVYLVSARMPGVEDERLCLAEVEGFVNQQDPVLVRLIEEAPAVIEGGTIARALVIGGYAVPLALG